jgi:hypothetical protein
MRTTAAEAANRKSGEFIAASRKAETDNVVSASGMTKAQIEAEQFRISQQSYALEQQRKTVQVQILSLEDQVYNITELREAKLLSIRDIETIIDGIRVNQLAKAQEHLDKLTAELAAEQAILDAQIAKIELQKLKWESIQISLDAYKAKLKTITDGELKSMLDMINAIAAAMATLSSPKFDNSSAFTTCPAGYKMDASGNCVKVTDPTCPAGYKMDASGNCVKVTDPIVIPEGETAEEKAARLKREADAKAAKDAADAKAAKDAEINAAAASAASAIAAAVAKAAGDTAAAAIAAAGVTPSALAAKESGAIGAASIAAQLRAAEVAVKNANTYASFRAKEAADEAAYNAAYSSKGRVGRKYGGMIPKYLASGGFPRGTDTIPAMLSPGEFVMSKYAVDSYGVDKMKAINSGSYEGEKVYNYNLNVNVKSDANPEDIARVVMTQIRQVDSQRIRVQRG